MASYLIPIALLAAFVLLVLLAEAVGSSRTPCCELCGRVARYPLRIVLPGEERLGVRPGTAVCIDCDAKAIDEWAKKMACRPLTIEEWKRQKRAEEHGFTTTPRPLPPTRRRS